MSKTVKYEVKGPLGVLLALPIIVATYAWLFLLILAAALVLLSPVVLIGFLVWKVLA